MRVLVTGGAGFIGSNLVQRLVADGHNVRVLDNLSTGKLDNIRDCLEHIEFVEGSILSRRECLTALENMEAVIHLAAMVSVPQSVENPLLAHEVNAEGSLTLYEVARSLGIRQIVQASTCAVYGSDPAQPKVESMAVKPASPYAASKLAMEAYAASYAECFGMDFTSLRFFNVYGPRQDPSSAYSGVISVFLAKAVGDGKVRIYGDGEQTRDFIFVDDICRALQLGLTKRLPGARVFNVATGRSVTLNQLVSEISQATGKSLTIEHMPPRPGDVRHSSANIHSIQGDLGFEAKTTLSDGLAQTFAWYSTPIR